MAFHPNTDQRELIADAFSRPLDDLLPVARLHQPAQREPWADLAELGIFGVAVDADAGGVGLGPVEEALLAIALGRKLAGPQIVATLMAVHLADDAQRAAIAAGSLRVAPAIVTRGEVRVVDGAGADLLLLRRDGEAALVSADTLSARVAVDHEHWTAPIEGAAIAAFDPDWAGGAAALRIRLIEAAALCGVAACASEMAVDYAGFRQQFGHPIGAFQSVKHQCANMAIAALAARDQTTFAAVALAEGRGDAAVQVESALLLAIEAALGNARRNVQVHGGIGFSEEADPHLVVKRAHLLVEAAGGGDLVAGRVAAAGAPLLGAG